MLIDGLIKKDIKNIYKSSGSVIPIIRKDKNFHFKFGEVYFSTIHPNVIKAWHLHTKISVIYSIIHGSVLCVIHDLRKDKSTYGNFEIIKTKKKSRFIIKVPNNVWVGFKCTGKDTAIIANITDDLYSKNKPKRLDPNSSKIRFDWNKERTIDKNQRRK
jgi:dTDP-4-dehydrorhamnose 3,5-epimerase